MTLLAYVLLGTGYGTAAAAQPGPFQAYLIAQALAYGWRRTLPAIMAPLLSDAPIIAVVLIFLTRIPGSLRIALHFLSGAFILYLAWSAYRQWRSTVMSLPGSSTARTLSPQHRGTRRSIRQATLMNLLGPGPYLFWSLVAGPVILQAWAASPDRAIGFLAGFYAAMLAVLAGIVLAFGSAERLGPRVARSLLGLSIVALAGFGIWQLWQGTAHLMAAVG